MCRSSRNEPKTNRPRLAVYTAVSVDMFFEMLRRQSGLFLTALLHVIVASLFSGRQLFGHQRPLRCHLQDSGQHDQRQNPRGDQEDFQHQK